MVDLAGTELRPHETELLRHPLVGAVLLYTRNYRNPQQINDLCGAIREARTPPPLVAVDHEGGRVQRFREGFTRLPPARALGRRYDEDRREGLALAHAIGWLMASELRTVGVDFSFAPCVDLDYGVSEVIGDRAFHRDPDAVAALAVAYMAGMREAGMAAVAKHFPGHGAVIADSHVALPVDRRNFVDLEADIRPYRPLIENNLAGVMGAHVVFPAIDTLPASLSKPWMTGVLREDLKFHGCVFADDLTMAGAAAFGGAIERAELAFAAGCDVLPICNDRQAVKLVLEHFGRNVGSPASQARVVRMRARGEAPANLGADRQWQQTVMSIANLSATPPLVLSEGSHDRA